MADEEVGRETVGIASNDADDSVAKFVNKLFKKGLKDCAKQHEHVRWAREFTAGAQWAPEDEAKLKAENRPTGVFNFTKRHVNVVSGVEILNRLQPQFLPRVIDNDRSQQLAELYQGVHDYVIQSCYGVHEISQAFRGEVNEGIGFMKWRLDLTDNVEPGGRIKWENCDSLHLVWDGDAMGRQNLAGARWFIYYAKVPKNEAANEWPDEAEYIKSTAPADYDGQFGMSAKIEQVVPPLYDPINKYETGNFDQGDDGHVIVKEAYWYADEDWMEYIDPFDPQGGIKEMPRNDWAKFKADFMAMFPEKDAPQGNRKTKRVYKRAFVIGGRKMEESDAPSQTGFPILPLTGEWDAKEKCYVGLARLLRDPQQYLNRYLANVGHAIATTPKGILLFEDGAFANPVMAEEQWAAYAPFIPMTEGAISGEKPKFEYIPPQSVAQAPIMMIQLCMQVFEEMTGINVEMLGAGEGEVPGVTMRQRQAVAMIAMAWAFSSYRRFLEDEARRTIEAVREFYTDERIIRVGGQYDGQAIQLFREDFSDLYDVVIDENPQNPNTRELLFQQISPILPALFKSGGIMQVPSVVDVFPGNARFRAELKRWIQGMGQQIAQAGGTPGVKGDKGGKGGGKQEDPSITQGRVALMDAKRQETIAKAQKLQQEAQLKQLTAMAEMLAGRAQGRREEEMHQFNLRQGSHRLRREHEAHRVGMATDVFKATRPRGEAGA